MSPLRTTKWEEVCREDDGVHFTLTARLLVPGGFLYRVQIYTRPVDWDGFYAAPDDWEITSQTLQFVSAIFPDPKIVNNPYRPNPPSFPKW